MIDQVSSGILVCIGLIISGLCGISTVAYHFFFRPLAAFPGPKLAIATFAYEWYYDLVLGGQYTFKLKELHKQYGKSIYGPVSRLNPDELHFDDPDYFDEIFNVTNGKADKLYRVANAFGPYPATIGTQDHDLHRLRRSAVNVFFSKRSVLDLVPHIQRIIVNFVVALKMHVQQENQ
ncbi:hypothetical protein HYALB_00011977 [Hymenoscyphus albidus]|uniref:Cytochrome P450 n=1 Tax=Hymenoscyphus albidus TaxID=595503 RepID=A0A9N9LK01_9HELO|nr:hypothetical protein HYALB_00011977 [Hymenoscyphus albidus]